MPYILLKKVYILCCISGRVLDKLVLGSNLSVSLSILPDKYWF